MDLGVDVQDAGASRVHHLMNRTYLGAIQVAIIIAMLQETSQVNVHLHVHSCHKLVRLTIVLVFSRSSRCDWVTEKQLKKHQCVKHAVHFQRNGRVDKLLHAFVFSFQRLWMNNLYIHFSLANVENFHLHVRYIQKFIHMQDETFTDYYHKESKIVKSLSVIIQLSNQRYGNLALMIDKKNLTNTFLYTYRLV